MVHRSVSSHCHEPDLQRYIQSARSNHENDREADETAGETFKKRYCGGNVEESWSDRYVRIFNKREKQDAAQHRAQQ